MIPEEIPNEDSLFYRIHKVDFDFESNQIKPVAFKPHGSGMSTEWSKYSSPIQCQSNARKPFNFGIVSMMTGAVRNIHPLEVKHTPSWNIAHTDVLNVPVNNDPFKEEIRLKLRGICKEEISVPK